MNDLHLNPLGNIFERLFAAAYLLLFPRRFLSSLFIYWHDLVLETAEEVARG